MQLLKAKPGVFDRPFAVPHQGATEGEGSLQRVQPVPAASEESVKPESPAFSQRRAFESGDGYIARA